MIIVVISADPDDTVGLVPEVKRFDSREEGETKRPEERTWMLWQQNDSFPHIPTACVFGPNLKTVLSCNA